MPVQSFVSPPRVLVANNSPKDSQAKQWCVMRTALNSRLIIFEIKLLIPSKLPNSPRVCATVSRLLTTHPSTVRVIPTSRARVPTSMTTQQPTHPLDKFPCPPHSLMPLWKILPLLNAACSMLLMHWIYMCCWFYCECLYCCGHEATYPSLPQWACKTHKPTWSQSTKFSFLECSSSCGY